MTQNTIRYPNKKQVRKYIQLAKNSNEGPWDVHSIYVAEAAELIAKACGTLNSKLAYALGGLHDIGRIEGYSHLHHVISGYNYMMTENYPMIAKICLTHSFPNKVLGEFPGKMDCNPDELKFMDDFLNDINYNDYDLLIQLCDSIASADGYCLMEKRMIDIGLRYQLSEFTQAKWSKCFEIKEYFERKIGHSIYLILPNVIENTFK